MLRATVVTSQGQGYERSQALGPESTECRAEKQGGSEGRLVGGGSPPGLSSNCSYGAILSLPCRALRSSPLHGQHGHALASLPGAPRTRSGKERILFFFLMTVNISKVRILKERPSHSPGLS